MLLQIIDKRKKTEPVDQIEVCLSDGDFRKSFFATYNFASHTINFKKDLDWYFSNYISLSRETSDKNVIGRLLGYGKNMGDMLSGENFEIAEFVDEIEERGYATIVVSLESARIEFFEEPWESLVLPQSKYVLSSATKEFNRKFLFLDKPAEQANIKLDLSKENSLNFEHTVNSTTSIFTNFEFQKYDGAVNHKSWRFDDWLTGRELLASIPLHIFQYDGPLYYQDGDFSFDGGAGQNNSGYALTYISLLELLKSRNCSLLILNVSNWFIGSDTVGAADTCLAIAAQLAATYGIQNVLGLNYITDPWTSQKCLNLVLRYLADGLSLSQAVVETRKILQKESEIRAPGLTIRNFQAWPLLALYSQVSITFFSAPQAIVDPLRSTTFTNIKSRMHGFSEDILTTYQDFLLGGILRRCVSLIENSRTKLVCIHGTQGCGKTSLIHFLSWNLLHRGKRNAFYFDFSDQLYSADQMQQMVLSVIQENQDTNAESSDIYLLDNFHRLGHSGSKEKLSEIDVLVEQLVDSGKLVIISSLEMDNFNTLSVKEGAIVLELPPLHDNEATYLSSRILDQNSIEITGEDIDHLTALVSALQGNPFLIRWVIAELTENPPEKLLKEFNRVFIDKHKDHYVDQYLNWQWSKMSIQKRRLLYIFSDLRGVIIEMVAIVLDSKSRIDAAKKLVDLVKLEEESVSSQLDSLEKSGFLLSYPLGRLINPRRCEFVKNSMLQDEMISNHQDEVKLLVARIICKSLTLVLPEALRKGDHNLMQNLLVNRGIWAKNLELAWQQGYYQDFHEAMSPLSSLLSQARLQQEFSKWSAQLIENCKDVRLDVNKNDSHFFNAWIKLLSFALPNHEVLHHHNFVTSALFFKSWLLGFNRDDVLERADLFTRTFQFLHGFYRETQQWHELYAVAVFGLQRFQEHEVWPLVVSSLNILIECATKLKDIDNIRRYEDKLLCEVPFSELPIGADRQIKTRIVLNRIERAEFDDAQFLLDAIRRDTSASTYQYGLLDIIQADLYYRQKLFDKAANLYKEIIDNFPISKLPQEVANPELVFFQNRYRDIQEILNKDIIHL